MTANTSRLRRGKVYHDHDYGYFRMVAVDWGTVRLKGGYIQEHYCTAPLQFTGSQTREAWENISPQDWDAWYWSGRREVA